MSKMKRIEGPWFYRPNKYDDWGTVRASDDNKVANACYDADYTDEELTEFRRTKKDPCEGNGHLIAAAPELYDALADIIEMAEAWADGKHSSHPDNGRCKMARAALAKAIGELK